MSDTNFSYMEVSAKRKKRNQFISVLIIVAIVLLGVIVWGWIELQKSRNAERIKMALNSQVEPGFKEPGAGLESLSDTGVTVKDVAPANSQVANPPQEKPAAPAQPVEAAPPPAEPAPKAAEPAKPERHAKHEAAPKARAAKPHTAKVRHESPAPKAEEPMQLAMNKPEAAEPPVETAKTAPPTKAYAPEDQPMPEKAEPSDEMRQAAATLPKAAAPAESPAAVSGNYKMGMEAYKQQDFVNAIRSFSAVPKPASKKRGDPERDEYVQANLFKGLALEKVGHSSEAVSAFQNVLEYEKYFPIANMNLGICYVDLKQYAKAHQAFEAVVRDQTRIDPATFDDVMQKTKYFWALAWTRLYKTATNPDKQNFYRQQAILKWKDYEVWFSKNDKYKEENLKAENYLKSLSTL